MTVQDLITSMLRDETGFRKAFNEILENELKMSLNEFCRVSGLSQSTMYKILEEQREPNLRTVRQIIKALNRMTSKNSERFLAVIASSRFMEGLPKSIETEAYGTVTIREYPVTTVEDAIIAAVRAERDGALALICAPIVANTLVKIISIKVCTVFPMDSVIKLVEEIKDDL